MDILDWLQDWYKSQCDGDWEHLFGVRIENLDNPGWMVTIDLLDTNLEDKAFEKIKYDRGENWLICRVENNQFKGDGDPDRLIKILTIFKDWAESA